MWFKLKSPTEAVSIAIAHVGHGVYKLGTGDCDTPRDGESDCAGFAINKCYGLRRHRPGFNKGPWASVEDDLNCNSAIEDAYHKQELFLPVYPGEMPPPKTPKMNTVNATDVPKPGDLLTYPTFTSGGHRFIGHIAIVVDVPAEWAWGESVWQDLIVVQCCGPDGRKPGIVQSSGWHWDSHDVVWPKPEHRSVLLRVKQVKGS